MYNSGILSCFYFSINFTLEQRFHPGQCSNIWDVMRKYCTWHFVQGQLTLSTEKLSVLVSRFILCFFNSNTVSKTLDDTSLVREIKIKFLSLTRSLTSHAFFSPSCESNFVQNCIWVKLFTHPGAIACIHFPAEPTKNMGNRPA